MYFNRHRYLVKEKSHGLGHCGLEGIFYHQSKGMADALDLNKKEIKNLLN
jgi:hypothetical protein